jgi:prolyl oligopeptidase
MGNALAERPELFAAAVINVGVLNALRFEHTVNGPPNIPEFGSVTSEDGFKGLLAMDAYTKVRDKTAYPAVLLTHGINDPRVEPWQSGKYAARLQAATSSGRPVLLRVEYDAGHGVGSTKRQRNEELADTYAFLLRELRPPADARTAQ